MRTKITRDVAIVGTTLALLSYEIVLGGARPQVLTALTGILLSPIVLRLDEARRQLKQPSKDGEDK